MLRIAPGSCGLHVMDYAFVSRYALLLCLVCTGIATAQRITVMVPDVQDAARPYYTDVLVPAFERETGIEVELILMLWAGFIDQFVALHAAGQAPGRGSTRRRRSRYLRTQRAYPPAQRMDRRLGRSGDFSPAAVADGMVDGKLYSIAYRLDQRPLMYRPICLKSRDSMAGSSDRLG